VLIKVELEDKGEKIIIGSKTPTIVVWCKTDGILSILPDKHDKNKSEITVVGLPSVVTAMESPESLAARINANYLALAGTGVYKDIGKESSNG